MEVANTTSTMDTAEGSDTGQVPSHLATAVGAAIMMVFFVEGLIGNIWISMAILLEKKTWNVVNIFILSLCINDLLSLCLIVVLIIDSYIWRAWSAGTVMCRLNPEFTVAFVGCSLWHTAFIAIHRYVVVVHNQLYKRMSKRAYIAVVLVLTRAIPVSVTLPGFSLNTSDYVDKLLRCILKPGQGGRIISVTVVQIILPCVVVLLCYAFIFTFVCRLGRQMAQGNGQMLRREIQITKMFGVIFLVIMLGFIPYSVIRNADKDNRLSPDIYVVVTVFYGIATCSNPLVYGMMSTEIRTACIDSLRSLTGAVRAAGPERDGPQAEDQGNKEGVHRDQMTCGTVQTEAELEEIQLKEKLMA